MNWITNSAAMLVADGTWDVGSMVNVEQLDPEPFLAILDRIGLPTEVLELEPGAATSFDGTVGPIEEEIARATATLTVSAADPMIALDPSRQLR